MEAEMSYNCCNSWLWYSNNACGDNSPPRLARLRLLTDSPMNSKHVLVCTQFLSVSLNRDTVCVFECDASVNS